MKTLILAAAMAAFSFPAYAATASWTGGMEWTTTVTFKRVLKCQYVVNYGQTFWQLIDAQTCPRTIEVE